MKYTKNDEVVEIVQDEDPIDPREVDNITKMVCFHKRYNLPNETEIKSGDFEDWEDLNKFLIEKCDAAFISPIYMLDHSGITISTKNFNDMWDSGQIGFIYITYKSILENKLKDEQAKELLETDVKIYDDYLTGNVYGFKKFKKVKIRTLRQKEGILGEIISDVTKDELEEIDSCWGFFGDNFKENGLFEHAEINKTWVKE